MTERFLSFTRGFIFPHECVYAKGHHGDLAHVVTENVDGDPGGLTKWGIDQASHPKVDIAHLDQRQAELIYWDRYWSPASPSLDESGEGVGEVIMNCRVNCGMGRATKIIARLPTLTASGFLDEQEAFYRRLVGQSPCYGKFLNGWINRTQDLRKYLKAG